MARPARGGRFAHYPWRDRNSSARRRTIRARDVRSLPLEGSQQGGGDGAVDLTEAVRSLPLEGSQHICSVGIGSAIRACGFAHYPWRDRNLRSHEYIGARPQLVRSLPLEGSQLVSVPGALVAASCSLITPGGIATTSARGPCARPGGGSLITPGGIATRALARAWRRLRPPGSLITPGGIATRWPRLCPCDPLRFAHYPWRDRNRFCRPRPSGWPLVRSLPLEGSQLRDNRVAAVEHQFAHYPWRDRNYRSRTRLAANATCSLITPGGIATTGHAHAWRPTRPVRSLPLEGSQRSVPAPA